MINVVDQLFRTKFNDEFHVDFERDKALLLPCVRSDGIEQGSGTIQWDVRGVVDAAETRTRDGAIPISQLDLSKVTATPLRHYKKFQIDEFDAFRTNPNVRAQMTFAGKTSINQAIDQAIIDQLDAGTLAINSGSAITFAAYATFLLWTNTLWANDVPNDGRVWGALTSTAMSQMLRIEEFKNSRYIPASMTPVKDGIPALKVGYYDWMGVKWFVHSGLTGKGGATAKCYIWHEDSLGHAIKGAPEMAAYYEQEEDRFGCWVKATHCAKVVLNRGIIRAVHDDTAAFA